MVTEGLNNIAVVMGRKVRELLEAEIVELDTAVAVTHEEYDSLKKQAEKKYEESNALYKLRSNKLRWLTELGGDIRELSRGRDGFPYLDDVAYEIRMQELRVRMQESADEMEKTHRAE